MASRIETTRSARILVVACSVAVAGLLVCPSSAWAQPGLPTDGGIFRLTAESSYQHGCFPPCLCPLLVQSGVRGVFKVTPVGFDGVVHEFAVEDVNWTVPFENADGTVQPLRVIGSGSYFVGSPDPITVVQHRMILDLHVGDEPVQHFDSGWVLYDDSSVTHINITVSINDLYCFDTAFVIDAEVVPATEIIPYTLVDGSTFQRGCFDPCDCLLGPDIPMAGTFAFVPLVDEPPAFSEFAVVDVNWHVLANSVGDSIPIDGFGVYQLLGDFIAQHRLGLELVVGNEEEVHFDSGIVPGGGLPHIDIVVTMNNFECFDTVLHVVADPANTAFCTPDGAACPAGEFCKAPTGHCDFDVPGLCTPIPEDCPFLWDPVCGCDGVTYPNECTSDANQVSLLHYGECEPYCFVESDCPEPNEFCKFPIGNCGTAALPGTCSPIPEACPDIYDPVCGCDGVTYGNECEADAAAVSILHLGPCERPCSEALGLPPCAAGLFCLYPEGTCDDGVHPGMCTPIPSGCPDVWDPVCGCDNVTYGNDCEAYAAGVSILHRGECARVCSRDGSHPPCEVDEFCKFPTGTCDDPTVLGVCTDIPEVCPEYYDPVCGCDGVTYGNECEAEAAAVSIDYWGPCEPTPCAATRYFLSVSNTYCPQIPLVVRIELTPPAGTSVVAIEDGPPEGWAVTNISHGGTFDSVNWKVKWGPFFAGSIPDAVSYHVIPLNDTAVPPCFSGTISVDGENERICGVACLTLDCPPFMQADLPQPPCPACPIGDCTTCPEGRCRDGRISLCELIGYACAWKVGCNDDLAGVTRAAYIWRHGECYCWDESEQNWFPAPCPPPNSGLCDATTPASSPAESAGGAAAFVRASDSRTSLLVSIRILAPADSATALEFAVPTGWKATRITDHGRWDGVHRKVKWGPFTENVARPVSFELERDTDRAMARRLRPDRKELLNSLSGRVSIDGEVHPVTIR